MNDEMEHVSAVPPGLEEVARRRGLSSVAVSNVHAFFDRYGEQTMKFACGVTARRNGPTNHSVFLVEAVSQAEAEGLALAIARKCYPADEGWYSHHAVVCRDDNVVTLDYAQRFPYR